MGSADHDTVRDYIASELTRLGLRPEIQTTTGIGTRYQEAGRVQNIAARFRGTDTNAKAVLLMAHYDGVEAGPAAADDGAGCAALLETLRALAADKHPPAHDIIALFTDGEESGLLGAAAFVRESPWAKDVAVVLNFEARGTTGRSFMFETGPGNLDAARALRNAPGATAGSVYATIYRVLPNDTDLSELSALHLPALNFAFADGVERYHTSRDDIAHLDARSLQHHGSQMLAMARTFAGGPLPRPVTGDGVFFDLPLVGLVVYPVGVELPLAIGAVALVVVVIVRERKGAAIGLLASAVALLGAAIVGWVVGSLFHGAAVWSGFSALSVALLSLSISIACRTVAMRWVTARAVHTGALIIWSIIAIFLAMRAPGTSYLFTWPLLFAAIARLVPRRRRIAEWATATATLLLLAGFIYGVTVVMLGVTGVGASALAIVTALVGLLLSPLLDVIGGSLRWHFPAWLASAGLAICAVVVGTARPSSDQPVRSALVYAENADSADAWLGTNGDAKGAWLEQIVGHAPKKKVPVWTASLSSYGGRFVGREVPRITLGVPSAVLLSDGSREGSRRVVLRVRAPTGATALSMRVRGVKVATSSVDGRIVDTSRYRYRGDDWVMQYWAVPDTGAIVALTIPINARLNLELASRSPGIPPLPGVAIPARPAYVVPSQTGDVSIVYRALHF